MRYAIFSDIHGNLEAYQEVIKEYKNEKIDQFLCIGDIVGYGADPKECIRKTQELEAITVAGNHDWAAVGLIDMAYFNPLAKQAIYWTVNQLDKEEKEFLKTLDLVYENQDLILVHGMLNEPAKFHYLLDKVVAEENFNLMKKNICFVGHSHTAGVFIEYQNSISYLLEPKIKIESNKNYIINVGSIGQPRDRDKRASYCIFDTEKKEVILKRINYNIKKTQEKIVRAGLPPFLASRLAVGY
jgi:predicted phosphodiesterase